MKKLLVSVLCLGAMACGDDVKKRPTTVVVSNNTANNTTSNNTTSNNTTSNNTTSNNTTSNNTANNTTSNNTTSNNTTSNNTTSNNTTSNNTTTNNTTSNNTANNTTNNTVNNTVNNTLPCTADPDFFGPIATTTNVYNIDAGLLAVYALVPDQPDDPITLENEGQITFANPIPVANAIVTATGFTSGRNFWVQDRNVAIEVYIPDLLMTIEPGMMVSFRATQVTNFEGHPEITGVDSFSVVSSGNPVPVLNANNRDISLADYGYVVKVGGELIGAPYMCGGNKMCYELEHNGYVSVFRTGSTFVAQGDCVTFVGPVRSFPGPRNPASTTAATPQLDTINFDWYWETQR